MSLHNTLSELSTSSKAWLILLFSTICLEAAALYFQYAMELRPCIMCIYQRTAVFGIMFSTLPVILLNNLITRFLAFVGWGVSSIWGLLIAIEHVDIQTATNPFFRDLRICAKLPFLASAA